MENAISINTRQRFKPVKLLSLEAEDCLQIQNWIARERFLWSLMHFKK